MKLVDYKNPETGEVRELDVHEIAGCQESGEIPVVHLIDGVLWKRVWGQSPIIIPWECQTAHEHHRFKFDKPLNGKKNIFQGGGVNS